MIFHYLHLQLFLLLRITATHSVLALSYLLKNLSCVRPLMTFGIDLAFSHHDLSLCHHLIPLRLQIMHLIEFIGQIYDVIKLLKRIWRRLYSRFLRTCRTLLHVVPLFHGVFRLLHRWVLLESARVVLPSRVYTSEVIEISILRHVAHQIDIDFFFSPRGHLRLVLYRPFHLFDRWFFYRWNSSPVEWFEQHILPWILKWSTCFSLSLHLFATVAGY